MLARGWMKCDWRQERENLGSIRAIFPKLFHVALWAPSVARDNAMTQSEPGQVHVVI